MYIRARLKLKGANKLSQLCKITHKYVHLATYLTC